MSTNHLKLALALIGLAAFIVLVVATVYLAQIGQPVPAAFTGTGAVAVAGVGLYKLLLTLGRTA